MNKKHYGKIVLLSALVLCILTGCSARQDKKYSMEELDNLAKIEIYSAKDNELIKTIEDEETLYQYNQHGFFDDSEIEEHQEELEKSLEGAREQYYFISYKYPAAKFGSREPEENVTLTFYENSNTVKMTVSEEAVKNISLPQEFLTFYYELSEEEMEFYQSLISH